MREHSASPRSDFVLTNDLLLLGVMMRYAAVRSQSEGLLE
jgi:hypothetical protein